VAGKVVGPARRTPAAQQRRRVTIGEETLPHHDAPGHYSACLGDDIITEAAQVVDLCL
jgi:hypothetical protein